MQRKHSVARHTDAGSAADEESVRVAVRIRPLNARELAENQTIEWEYSDTSLLETTTKGTKVYSYDAVFAPEAMNGDVYSGLASGIVQKALHGFNGTVFTYGQTGSGKTHSILGTEGDPGIIRLSIRDVYAHIAAHPELLFGLKASYMEVYNEEINDLLQSRDPDPETGEITGLNMRIVADDPQKGAIVEGLVEEDVFSAEQMLGVIARGESNRHYGCTDMNATSSRSHTIFRMVLCSRPNGNAPDVSEAEFARLEGGEEPASGGFIKIKADDASADAVMKVSYLNLVDLAGSERQKNTNTSGQRLKEGANINRSLLALGAVISKLGEMSNAAPASGAAPTTSSARARAKSRTFVPYRDSKLTRILKQSLGGNTFTAMLCTMTPAPMHHEESVSTLKFGRLCKTIKNKATCNEVADDKTLLRQYRQRIVDLKEQLAAQQETGPEAELHLREDLDRQVALANEQAGRERERAEHLEAKVGRLQAMVMRQQSSGGLDDGEGGEAGAEAGTDRWAPAMEPRGSSSGGGGGGGGSSGSNAPEPKRPTRRRSVGHIEPARSTVGDHPLEHVPYEQLIDAFSKLSNKHSQMHREALAVMNVEKEELAVQVEHLQASAEAQRNQMYQTHEEELALMEDEMHEMQATAESEMAGLRERIVGLEQELQEQRLREQTTQGALDEHQQMMQAWKAEADSAAEREQAARSRVEEQKQTISTMQERIVGKDGRRLSIVAVELEQERLKMNDRVKNLSRREARLLEKETRIAVLMAELDERESTVQEKMLNFERQASKLTLLYDGFAEKRRAVEAWELAHQAREGELNERQSAVEATEAELAARASSIVAAEDKARLLDLELSTRAEEVDRRESEVAEQEERTSEREERVREWNGMLMTRESSVDAKEADLKWREEQLASGTAALAEGREAMETARRELEEARGLHEMRAAGTRQQEQDLAIKLEAVRRREETAARTEEELAAAEEEQNEREAKLDKQQRSLMLREHVITGKERDQDVRESLLEARESADAELRARETELQARISDHEQVEEEFFGSKAAQINNMHRKELQQMETLLETQHAALGKTSAELATASEQLAAALEENKRLTAGLNQAKSQSWLEGLDAVQPGSTKGLLVERLSQSLSVLQGMLREQGVPLPATLTRSTSVVSEQQDPGSADAGEAASSPERERERMSPARRILGPRSPGRPSPAARSPASRARRSGSPSSPKPTVAVDLIPSSPKKPATSFSLAPRFAS